MKRIALFILCAFMVAVFFGAARAKADELSPPLVKAYTMLEKYQPLYLTRLDGTPLPEQADRDMRALVSACLARVGSGEDGEFYTLLSPAQRQACADRKAQVVGTLVIFLLGVLLIGLIALVQRLRRGVALGGRYAGATR